VAAETKGTRVPIPIRVVSSVSFWRGEECENGFQRSLLIPEMMALILSSTFDFHIYLPNFLEHHNLWYILYNDIWLKFFFFSFLLFLIINNISIIRIIISI